MIPYRLVTAFLTVALVLSMPTAATAQDVTIDPEGSVWKLTSYATDDGVVAVPFGISATLRLEAGLASGSGGCNTFNGSYQLDGASLTFSDEIATTLRLCAEEVQAVEDAFLAALTQVAGWAIAEDVLELSDQFGDAILTLEVPGISLTASELLGLVAIVEGLQSEIDTLRRDMTQLNVDRLRERIRVLERDAGELKDQVAALEEGATATIIPLPNSFSAAETILLEAIPPRINSRCQPLRSELPKGAKAGLTCIPNSAAVASVAYYLLEGADAAAAFQDTMATFNVPDVTSESATCATGDKSQRIFIGRGWQSEGCYRTAERAELRFVDNATDCTQLTVDGKRLRSPALYIALQGTDGDVARVHGWATRSVDSGSTQITSITQPIERPGERLSPSCPT